MLNFKIRKCLYMNCVSFYIRKCVRDIKVPVMERVLCINLRHKLLKRDWVWVTRSTKPFLCTRVTATTSQPTWLNLNSLPFSFSNRVSFPVYTLSVEDPSLKMTKNRLKTKFSIGEYYLPTKFSTDEFSTDKVGYMTWWTHEYSR